ncbi:MAG: hypothetical protein PVI41_05030, partial [Roseobacter sp.]
HRQCRDTVGRSRRFSLHPHQAEKSATRTFANFSRTSAAGETGRSDRKFQNFSLQWQLSSALQPLTKI